MGVFRGVLEIVVNFSSNTNIHGFGYIVQSGRWKVERLFWFLCVVVSLALTGLLVHKLVAEERRNPTVIYTDQNVVHTTDILFPSVSLVPGLILKTPLRTGIDYVAIKQQLLSHQLAIDNFTAVELKRLQIASLIARDGFMAQFNVTIPTDDLVECLREDFPSVFVFRRAATLKGLKRIPHFVYGNWSEEYSVNLTEVLCPTGLCYTFNMPDNLNDLLNINELSRDFNYEYFIRLGMYLKKKKDFLKGLVRPLKGPKNGKGLLLKFAKKYEYIGNNTMVISVDKHISIVSDNNTLVHEPSRSFQILDHSIPGRDFYGMPLVIHGPYEIISSHLTRFHVLNHYDIKLLITPKLKNYDDTLTEMSIEDRQCYLQDEPEGLKFFNTYNRINCEHECLSNLTLKSCGCTQFFMVREPNTNICGVADERCFRRIESDFQATKTACRCFDMCERVDYDVTEIAIKQYRTQESPEVQIDFAVDKALPQSRRKQQTVVGFLSLVGGFFGLFAGFSVLSGFELLYYFMLEPLLTRSKSRISPMSVEQRPATIVKGYCNEFFDSSSIHGFNHIGNGQKSMLERFIWLLLFIAAMTGSYYMVKQVYKSLQLNQIMMTMEGRVTSVEEIPFPAITITDRVQMFSMELSFLMMDYGEAYRRGANAFNKVMDMASKSGVNNTYNEIYATLCENDRPAEFLEMFDFKYNYPSEFVDTMRRQLSDRAFWAKSHKSLWNAIRAPPYAETLTKRGFGHTFNIVEEEKLLNFSNLSPDFHYHYEDSRSAATFPWATTADNFNGLSVEVIRERSTGGCGPNHFALHGFNELPIGVRLYPITMENAYDVLVTPNFVTVDEDLRLVDVNVRQCYFEGERRLNYFKVYTRKNCEMECLSHAVYRKCGCVPFHFVRRATMEICDFSRIRSCLVLFDETLPTDEFDELYRNESVCGCYPQCNSIAYEYEVLERYNRVDKNFKHSSAARTSVTFRYKNGEHFALLRYQPFKLVDFLSYVGGILGLFAGISVLSIVEIFYYFTLRVTNDALRYFRIG